MTKQPLEKLFDRLKSACTAKATMTDILRAKNDPEARKLLTETETAMRQFIEVVAADEPNVSSSE